MVRKVIIWPEHLYAPLARREGRRVSKELAIDKLALKELLNACRRLGFKCAIEEEKKYPPLGIKALNYRLTIELPDSLELSKNQLIKKLAKAIKRKF